jgi:RHS repeat-associated protein
MVARDAAFTQILAKFVYDESGNRIEKLTYNSSYVPIIATYYFGDVIYTCTITGGSNYGQLTVQEYRVTSPTAKIGTYFKQSNTYSYELKDHLGNVRAVLASTGSIQTANDYYPYGLVIATYGTGYRYGYQGENAEVDGESGWNSFTLRMYNPRFGKWMTVDPKNVGWSPYFGMGNDPVSKIDADGGAPWKPDQNGNLVAEKGDNIYTLMDYLNVNYDAAAAIFYNQNNWSGGSPFVSNSIVGQTLKIDNVYTRSIEFSKNNSDNFLTENQIKSMGISKAVAWERIRFPDKLYNCWGSSIFGTSGTEIKPGEGIQFPGTFDDILKANYMPIPNNGAPQNQAIFGKTVLRFASVLGVQHGAVFYGQSHDGTIYVYTKNGWFYPPTVMPLSELISQFGGGGAGKYGNVQGMDISQSGWYIYNK